VTGFSKRCVVCLVGISVWVAIPAGADDDYLSILEAEARDTGGRVDEATVSDVARPEIKVRSVQDNQTIKPAMDFEAFEVELNTYYSGTWFLYEKLDSEQRRAVYSTYRQDNRTASVREKIVKLLTSR